MSQLSKILRDADDNMLIFQCPGCKMAHGIRVGEGTGPRWTFNGCIDKPTFNPSIIVRGTDLTEKGKADLKAHYALPEDQRPELPEGFKFDGVDTVCHSFVRDGRIQFLNDCTHALAGQTVDLPEWGE